MTKVNGEIYRPEKKQFFSRGSNFLGLNNYIKGMLAAGIVMGALVAAGAENEKLAITPENWLLSRNCSFAQEGKDGAACLKATVDSYIFSKGVFSIDPSKTYVLSGDFKSEEGKEGKLYFGFQPLDKKMQPISSQHVNCQKGTETELAAACAPGDTVIKIKDGAKWEKMPYGTVAFDIDASGKYADLPNRNLSSIGIAGVEKKDDCWEVTLSKPCGMAYPVGTKVRQQYAGVTYIYCAAFNAVVPDEWKTLSGKVTGMAEVGTPHNKFWAGTTQVKIILMPNHRGKSENVMLIDNITLTEQAE